MECGDALKGSGAEGNRCIRLAETKPDCGCEADVARLIYSPLHIDPDTREVTEAAFSDVKDKGLSVQREGHTTPAALRALGEKKRADDWAKGKTDRVFLGIVTGPVQAIRELTYEGGARTFCVYDSALLDQRAHADVCQVPSSPSAMKRARKKLRDLFQRMPRMP